MKILKISSMVLALLLFTFWILTSILPESYSVEFKHTFKDTEALQIFPLVSHLKKHTAWNPWMQKDSTIIPEYSKSDSSIGSFYFWTSEYSGTGRQTLTQVKANTLLEFEFDYGRKGRALSRWVFLEEGSDLLVTQTFSGHNKSRLGRIFAYFMEDMTSPIFVKSFENLEKVKLPLSSKKQTPEVIDSLETEPDSIDFVPSVI
jgi:hypothetical protein